MTISDFVSPYRRFLLQYYYSTQIEYKKVLLYGCPICGLPQSNYNLRIKIEDTHHVKVGKLADECFQAIDVKDTNIISVRRLAKRHEVSVTVSLTKLNSYTIPKHIQSHLK